MNKTQRPLFESGVSNLRTRLAQLVEHRIPNPKVGGSTPSARAITLTKKIGGDVETLVNWKRIYSSLAQQARTSQIAPDRVSEVVEQLKKILSLCGPASAGRKVLQRIGFALLSGRPKIIAPACPDYSHCDGKYTFRQLNNGISLLAQKQIDFLRAARQVLTEVEVTVAVADQEADDESLRKAVGESIESFRTKIRKTIEAIASAVKQDGWCVAAMTSVIPEFAEQEKLWMQRIRSDSGLSARITTDSIARSEMYRRIAPFTAEEMFARTLRTAAQYLTLGTWAQSNNALIANHTTTNLAWYLQTGAGILHNPIAVY